MERLQLRSYTREEMSEITGANINDSRHFKRDVESTLQKWGYLHEYKKKNFIITKIPETADEKLKEILIREYKMDSRIDTYSFSAFLYSLAVFPEFASMPWEERANWLEVEFNIKTTDRTLRSWCSSLIGTNTLFKDNDEKTVWLTGYTLGEKYRVLVTGDADLEREANEYYEYRRSLLIKYNQLEQNEKWNQVRTDLWNKYHLCYYYCKNISFTAFDDIGNLQEVIELVNEIAEREPEEIVKEKIPIVISNKETIMDDKQFHF